MQSIKYKAISAPLSLLDISSHEHHRRYWNGRADSMPPTSREPVAVRPLCVCTGGGRERKMAKKASKPRIATGMHGRFEEIARKVLRGHDQLVYEVSRI